MPRKLPIPFGIRTTVFQEHSSLRRPFAKGGRNQSDDHHPFGGVWQFLLRCSSLPRPKIFRLHDRRSTGPVEFQVADRPGHLFLLRHHFVNLERVQCHRYAPPLGGNSPIDLYTIRRHPCNGDLSWWGGGPQRRSITLSSIFMHVL